MDRGRHQFRRFFTGISKHDALVAGTFVFVAGRINAHSNVGRLRVDMHSHIRLFPMETILFIANVFDGMTRDAFKLCRQ